MKWAKDWWFEMVELDGFDEKILKAMAKGWFRTKLHSKVLNVQITNEMGEGLVI